jgi:anthranilate phosphoribosyltransferase
VNLHAGSIGFLRVALNSARILQAIEAIQFTRKAIDGQGSAVAQSNQDFAVPEATEKIASGGHLSRVEAERVMEAILAGHVVTDQIAALLLALRTKGESVDEVIGFATAMRRHATTIFPAGHKILAEPLIDTCGTGGDARGTFNISTVVAFVVAGAGIRVAKHGNRSTGGRSGSADVLEAVGVQIDLPPTRIAHAIEHIGIGFLFAPAMHAATRHATAARQQLKVRTVFNLLGPLTNPANATAQIVGVYDAALTEVIARALGGLGVRRAFVVHGADGLDEISLSGETFVSELRDGAVRNFTITSEDFGLPRAPLDDLRGGNARQNAETMHKILGTANHPAERGARRDIVLANAAAALVASGQAMDFMEGVRRATESIDSGAARKTLEALIAFARN